MRAYILMKVTVGMERTVMEQVRGIPGLEEVHVLFGDYDYILALQAPDMPALVQLVTSKIRTVHGVEKTVTLLEAPI